MNRILSHIEFLLHEHNCVVVPDLGGFLVNVVPSHQQSISKFCAPVCELVFNRDLQYNDGLLAQSYMKTDALSFEAATRKIEQEVHELKKQLHEKRYVELGKLGMFTMHDNERFVYTPATFVRPDFFGLQVASLQPLIQMPVPVLPSKRATGNLRKFSVRAAAAVVAGLLLFAIPGNDATVRRQSAQMFPIIECTATVAAMPVSEEMPETQFETTITPPKNENITENLPAAEIIIENQPTYYIIVGVFEFVEGANRTMSLLAAKGITQAAKVEHSGRFFVTAASFHNRSDAENGLRRFHREHPMYFDAWIRGF